MNTRSIAGAVAVGATLAVGGLSSACDAPSADSADVPRGVEAPAFEPGVDSASEDLRPLWLAMADEPLHHMRLAHELLAGAEREQAALQLETSASLFRWGGRYVDGRDERQDFSETAQELESAARRLRRGDEVRLAALDLVLTAGLRAMAEHHAIMALDQWTEGEHDRAAKLLRASAGEVRCALSLSDSTPDDTVEHALWSAESVAARLDSRSPPDEREVGSAVRALMDSASGLAALLGSRGR